MLLLASDLLSRSKPVAVLDVGLLGGSVLPAPREWLPAAALTVDIINAPAQQ
jgi:hypothetical protein